MKFGDLSLRFRRQRMENLQDIEFYECIHFFNDMDEKSIGLIKCHSPSGGIGGLRQVLGVEDGFPGFLCEEFDIHCSHS